MRKLLPISFALLLLAGTVAWATAPKYSPEYEKEVGDQAAAEVEKQYKGKVTSTGDEVKKLDTMADTIAKVSGRPDVKYTVKIIKDSEINAFSLPGGHIFVTTALLKDVQSDDELAGVLAHEITHNVFYDALEEGDRSKKLFMGSMAATLVALLLGANSEEMSGVLAAGEYIRQGILSQYSMGVETRADHYAVEDLIATKKWNPVGLLTFMERLAASERHKPQVDMGILADHPDTNVRVHNIINWLEAANVDINRRAVTKWEPPKAEEKDIDGKKTAVLSLWGVELFRTTDPADAGSALKRTEAMAKMLDKLLAANLAAYEISADTSSSPPTVLLRGEVFATVHPEDVPKGETANQVADHIVAGLGAALHKEELERWF